MRIRQNSKSYIRVSGLRLENAMIGGEWPQTGPCGIRVSGSDHILVESNSTYNTKSSGIYFSSCSNVVADGNDIQQAVNGGRSECLIVRNTTDFEIANNAIHNGVGLHEGGEGIDVKEASGYGKVYGNHVYDLPGEDIYSCIDI